MRLIAIPFAAASALALGGCSQGSERTDAEIAATESAAATSDDSAIGARAAAPPAATDTPAGAKAMLALEELGELVVGEPVPAGSSFAERGAPIGAECRTVSAPEHPGVYAITNGADGPVRRITVGQRAHVELAEGIGIGASESEVLAAFPGFRASRHTDVPAKYLTQPGNDPRLRFEIGENGRVSLIHVGNMPELGYVEGCA